MTRTKKWLTALIFCLSLMFAFSASVNAASNPCLKWQDTEDTNDDGIPDGDGYKEITCTWFCWQQVYDTLGIALPADASHNFAGHAKSWIDAANGLYTVGDTPKLHSIAVWTNTYYGHVAFVTSVDGDNFLVNEGGRTDLDHTESQGVAYGVFNRNSSSVKFIYLTDNFKYHIDKCEGESGSFHLSGWVYNEANVTKSIQVHVYLDGGLGSGAQSWAIPADLANVDVDEKYHVGAFHGFDYTISGIPAGPHTLYLFANDQYLNTHTSMGTRAVTVYGELPVISDVQVTDISREGYTVSCLVEGNISKVEFPTWTPECNGQDDIIWGQGALENGRYVYRVRTSDHNYEDNCVYRTHIYAWEPNGGSSSVGNSMYPALDVFVPPSDDDYTYPITGTWGENLTWSINSSGVLTVAGVGEMEEYGPNSSPLLPYSNLVKEVRIGPEVTSISPGAFVDFANLEKAVIGDHVLSIGVDSFRRCASLSEVILPDGLLSVGGFCECTSLKTITIPDSTLSIDDSAFAYSGLESIIIPDRVTSIGYHAFEYCEGLRYIALPKSLSSCEGDIFAFNPLLIKAGPVGSEANIEFNWETAIPAGVFCGCSDLENVVIPEGITKINSYAFMDTHSMTEIWIPRSVSQIREDAFNYRPWSSDTHAQLTVHYAGTGDEWDAISIENDNDQLRNAIVEIPLNAVPLNEMVALPEGLEEIGEEAFDGTNLSAVAIPDGCTSIGSYAFANNESLKALIPASVQSIGYGAFDYSPNVRLYVYRGSEAVKYAQTYGIRFFQIADGG